MVNMLVGIIYRPSSITSQIPQALLNEGPWIEWKSFHPVFVKLGEYVGGQNTLTKVYNQPNPPGTPEFRPWIVQKGNKRYMLFKSIILPQMSIIEFTTNTTDVFCVSFALLLFKESK